MSTRHADYFTILNYDLLLSTGWLGPAWGVGGSDEAWSPHEDPGPGP
jgi:hypothetical protein